MHWRDEGLLLNVRRHGENGAIIDVLTAEHGRHGGLVRGGAGLRLGTILQPGAQLSLEWSARLEDHLGTFKVEPVRSRAAPIMADRVRLAGLNSMSAMLLATLAEREADAGLYAATISLVDAMAAEDPYWPATYARWELDLLATLGFGLDLTRCAASGVRSDLAYVSPRTGRAVSRAAGGVWADKLLTLPAFLIGRGPISAGSVREAMRLTGHFFEQWMLPAFGQDALPAARQRLSDILEKHDFPTEAPPERIRDDEAAYHEALGQQHELKLPDKTGT